MKLILAVLQPSDVAPLLQDLAELETPATRIEGDGSAADGALSAIIIGVDDGQVADVLALIRASAGGRVRPVSPLRPIAERAEFWIPGRTDLVAGGASVFVLPIRRFERIGYA